ncbi:MAG: nitrous oxide reductase family maturation protein NosD [Candidatus Latescibacteria bacterium]|nr:nitrous oxide reductase family maturation protein NosD [Candidatus Latescibacterota bacterium]
MKAVLISLLLLSGPVRVSAERLTVGPGQAFLSIRAAVERAQPGDTVRVQAGTYREQVELEKPLVLEGIGRPVLRGSGQGSVLVARADRCTVTGFIIEHSGGDLQQEDSGILLKSSRNRIENNELRDILFGIYLYQSQGNTIRRNVIRGRRTLPVGDRGAGLHLWNSPENVIEENTISDARDGMYIQNSPDNRIRSNRVFGLRYGVHYMYSDANRFEDNLFSRNVAGAAIMYSKRIVFRRNAFVHNRGFSSFGILFQDCEECIAEENFILDNATGLFLEALRRSTFRRNIIAENDVAIQMFSSAENNLFTGNNFVENLSPLQLIGRQSTTRWGRDGRGNFWSEYDGYDLDGDGVGDVPHKVQNVFEYLEGNYPRLRLYLQSPAAQALAVADQAFPVVEGSPEVDATPLMRPVRVLGRVDQARPRRSTHGVLAAIALAMLSAALAVIWIGQRRRAVVGGR